MLCTKNCEKIEIPISGEILPDEYDPEHVSGGQAMIH